MQNQLHKLNDIERQQLLNAPVLITLLIAGADGKSDERELDWATRVTHFRKETAHFTLQYFYEVVGENFNDKLKQAISNHDADTAGRKAQLTNEIAQINPILAKLDEHYREKLVESFRSLAEQVAEGSGGIMGFFSTSKEESTLMKLEMIEF
ncbi:MAG: hypothetical protein IPK03_15840 [Bacteroidetes bacterium]|nr:hypothetical protein [Bacteroidota bacterium]